MRSRVTGLPLVCLMLSFVIPAAAPRIRGRIRLNPHTSIRRLPPKTELWLMADGRTAGHGFADSTGLFTLSVSPVKDSVLDLYCVAPGPDTLFLRSLANRPVDSLLSILFPCEPETTEAGEIICPKCRKEDQVYPMTFGDPIVIKRHFDTTGKVSYEKLPTAETPATPVVHAARYYCRRDKITF